MNRENQNRNFDQTFVEGQGGSHPSQPGQTNPGGRVDYTQVQSQNPYTQTGQQTQTPHAGMDPRLPQGLEGELLGSGKIVGVLGTGGMARVYKIWNEKLEIFRAVKVLIPSGGSDLVNRFETEAKITAKLHHPNIVEVYNVGEVNELPFLEMEYIDGKSLEELLAQRGKFPDVVCCALAIQIAHALAYAHSQQFLIYGKQYQGVIHRDLKPANIMLSLDRGVRLMDFGIARPTEASLHTVEGNIVGTMQYLSPEQLDGVDIDNRSDIYSFGTILYELVTGHKTFPQETITNLMKKKITGEYRKFQDFDFSVSPQLANITRKCLQIEKAQRYASANELGADIVKVYRNLTEMAPKELLTLWMKSPNAIEVNTRHKKRISPLVITIVVAAIAVIGGFTWFLTNGPSIPNKNKQKLATQQQNDQQQKSSAQNQATEKPQEQAETGTEKSASSPPPETQKPEPAPVTRATPPPPPPRAAVAPVRQRTSPRPTPQKTEEERFLESYNTSNMETAFDRAYLKKNWKDVQYAAEKAENLSARQKMFLAESYLVTDNLAQAEKLLERIDTDDGYAAILNARLYQQQNKLKLALDKFQEAMLRPSQHASSKQIRGDALYYTARIRSEHYQQSPSTQTRMQALTAWNVVKRYYSSDTNSERFIEANREMASIQ